MKTGLFVLIIIFSFSADVISQGPSYEPVKNVAVYSEMVQGIQIVKGAWQPMFESDSSASFIRKLSNGVDFGGSVIRQNENALEIWIENGSGDKMEDNLLNTYAK